MELTSHCAAQNKRLRNLESDLQRLKRSHAALNKVYGESEQRNADLTYENALLKELADLRVEDNFRL